MHLRMGDVYVIYIKRRIRYVGSGCGTQLLGHTAHRTTSYLCKRPSQCKGMNNSSKILFNEINFTPEPALQQSY